MYYLEDELPCISKLLINLADEFDMMHKMVHSRYVAERIYMLRDELHCRLSKGDEDDFDPLKEWNASQERIAVETPPGTGLNNPHWPVSRSKDESCQQKAWAEFRKKNPHLY